MTNTTGDDCGCGGTSSTGTDFERAGKALFLDQIQRAAREALAALPDSTAPLNKPGRVVVDRLGELYVKAASAAKWTDSDVAAFALEMSWVKVVIDLQVVSLARDSDGGGGYGTNCSAAYDKCMSDSGCTRDGWVCLCCIPCSITYSRCVLGLPFGGSRWGIFAV